MSVTMPSVPLPKPRFPADGRLPVKECIANIGIPLDFFGFFCHFNDFCWSLQTSLLCIIGELAEAGSVAVAVGVSER